MYLLKVKDDFDAAHRVADYPGKCDNLHGHTWEVEIAVTGEKLDNLGMVVDFKFLKTALKEILKEFDHQYLNELPLFADKNPTAEHIAAYIFAELKKKLGNLARAESVTVWESPVSAVVYSE